MYSDEISKLSVLSIKTLRFYSEGEFEMIAFMKRLKFTGMSLKEVEKYITPIEEGRITLLERIKMFENQKEIIIK